MRTLTDKEQLIVAIAKQIQPIICKKSHESLLKRFSPEGEPTGLIFSQSYKPLIKKQLFGADKYFILVMQCGESVCNGFSGTVTNWCQSVYQFSTEVDFLNFTTYLELSVKLKKNPRLIMENLEFI